MGVNPGSKFFDPTPGAAGVIQVNMRGQQMLDVSWSKSDFFDPFNYGIEVGFRTTVDQEQFLWSTFDKRDAKDVGCAEVKGVDQVNHSDQ